MSRTPHDKLFKRVFKEPRHAAEALAPLLPPRLSAAIEWDGLKRESETHVDESLADIYSDLIFSASAGDTPVRIYVLFEHQSTNDPRMALRLLEYMVKVWTDFVRDSDNAGQPLPLVIPVVLAHVPGGWTAKRRFAELFTPESTVLAPKSIPDFEYEVDDLAKATHEELRQRAASDAVKLTLWMLRDARDGRTFLMAASQWAALLDRLARSTEHRTIATALVTYVWLVLDDETMDAFRAILADEAPMAEGLTMTSGEKLLERGRAKGKLETQIESVLLVLEARGIAVSEEQRQRVQSCHDEDVLTRWMKAAATAESAEAALR